MSKIVMTLGTLLLAASAQAGILRYTVRALDSSADPDARIPQLIVADTAAECPATDVGDGDLCYAKDTDRVQIRANAAWANVLQGTVGDAEIAAGAVDGGAAGEIADGSVTSDDLGTNSVGADEVAADSVALTTDTTGNYAAGDGEAGNALTGDTATAFFSAGTIEDDRIDGSAEADEVNPTLGTQTQGNYALGDAEGGAATTGDSATDFFSAGTVNDARVDGSAEADELVLAGDVDGTANSNDLDESAVESELESVLDLVQLQGVRPITAIDVCPPGMTAVANICITYTNLPAAFTGFGQGSHVWMDFSGFTEFRITSFLAVTAATGDIEIQCDADGAFGSAAVLGQLANPAQGGNVGSWTSIPANECTTADGVWVRGGMINGNTTEDPSIRRVTLELR